jgi:cytochrome b561
MALANSAVRFGLLSRTIHWAMAALLIAQLALGLSLDTLPPGLGSLWYYGMHKTLGITALALVVLRILWHRISPPPAPLGPPVAWEQRAAQAGHLALYALMLALPVSGWVASSASGIDTVIFGALVLPAIAPASEAWETAGFAIHAILGKALIALLILHMLGAIKREIGGDGTLSRMLRGR